MNEPTYVKASVAQAGTAGNTSYVTIRKNEVIELLKTLDGLKRQLQPLLK